MNRAARLVSAMAFGIASVASVGCSRETDDRASCVCEPASPVVDEALLAFLSQARAAHHDADLAERAGDRRVALGPLLGVAGSPLLRHAPPPEAREVAADTLARIAELQSALGDFDPAIAAVESGLTHAKEATYFRGHLFEVQGLVQERRAASQEAAGDDVGAAASRRDAMTAFEAAIAIQEEVIQRALSGQGAGAR